MNKDKITNICGIVAAIAGSLMAAEKAGLNLPAYITPICTGIVAVCVGVIGFYTGKPNA